jgi:hypothetical protein
MRQRCAAVDKASADDINGFSLRDAIHRLFRAPRRLDLAE